MMVYSSQKALLLCIFFIIAGTVSGLYAQAHDFRSYTVSDGLPHGQITSLHQCDDGYMWIGTIASGLSRFDGTTFKTYGISEGLKDDMISVVFEDSQRNLWVGTYNGGIAKLDSDTLVYQFIDQPLDTSYVNGIFESPDGEVWFTTFENGVFVYNGIHLEQINTENGLIYNTVWDVLWNDDGSIWFATHDGLSIFKEGEFTNYSTSDGLSGSKVFQIVKSDEGAIWLATNRGVTVFDGDEIRTITEINGKQLQYVFDMVKGSDGRIWLGMENDGIYWYDKGRFTHVTKDQGLVSNYIHNFFEDKNGNMWIGTDENGISIYRGESFRFHTTSTGLLSNEVLAILNDSHNGDIMWIGTDRGLQSHQNNIFEEHSLPHTSSREHIWDIAQKRDGSLLLMLDDNTIWRYDGNRGRNFIPSLSPNELYMYGIYVDSNDILWIGTDTGLYRHEGNELKSFGTAEGIPGVIIYHIYEASDSTLWLATNNGVAFAVEDRFEAITFRQGLGHYNVNYITQDQFGEMWFGTSAGVTHYVPETESSPAQFRNFGKNDGMKLVETNYLWFDENDQLWQGTNGGIHRLDVASYRTSGVLNIEHYAITRHGIGIETVHKAIAADQQNRIHFGTMEGIVVLDPNTIGSRESNKPITYIEKVLFNGAEIDWSQFQNTARQVGSQQAFPFGDFPYGKNTLTFVFKGIDFLSPENLQYRYRLRGFDENWITLGTSNSTTYTGLSAGNYELLVQSRVGIGSWSDNTATYRFTVAYPFWQMYWFWALVVVVMVLVMLSIIKFRVNRIELDKLGKLVDEQTAHLVRAVSEKETLLKEVHHRVKNNLAIIYGMLEMQMEYLPDAKVQAAFKDSQLRVYSISLVHEKLYQSDDISQIEAKTYIPELAKSILKSLALENSNVNQHLDIDDISLTLDQGIPCGLILNELISNAYKHAFNGSGIGNLFIDFKRKDGHVLLRVKDDGKGLPKGFVIGSTQSLGLILVNGLISQIRAEMDVFSDSDGTTFQITFSPESV